jgi:hypothetical protein
MKLPFVFVHQRVHNVTAVEGCFKSRKFRFCLRVVGNPLDKLCTEDMLDLNCYASLCIEGFVVKGKGLSVTCHADTEGYYRH